MIRSLVLAPAALLALLSIATPVSAQAEDLHAQVVALRTEQRHNHSDFRILQRCGEDDPAEVQRVSDTAADIARRAGALALRVPTKDHVVMLTISQAAELDSWLVWTTPERCYQPPAE